MELPANADRAEGRPREAGQLHAGIDLRAHSTPSRGRTPLRRRQLRPRPGRIVGNELVESPKVDKVSFTGETATGKNILQRAAVDLKRVSLELGGKNPFVMFSGADLEAAARSLVFGMYRNAGQACGSTSRLSSCKMIFTGPSWIESPR